MSINKPGKWLLQSKIKIAKTDGIVYPIIMLAIESIYNPASDELEDRMRTFKSVAVAYEQISVAGASELLGEAQDVSDAKKIIRQSMVEASKAIGSRDLDIAEQMGLLTDTQVRDYSILMQRLEFEALKKGNDNRQSQQSGQR